MDEASSAVIGRVAKEVLHAELAIEVGDGLLWEVQHGEASRVSLGHVRTRCSESAEGHIDDDVRRRRDERAGQRCRLSSAAAYDGDI